MPQPRASGRTRRELEPEATRLTDTAYRVVGELVGREVQGPLVPAEAIDGTLIYLWVMGQSSITGHGKQGMNPERVDYLRRLDSQTRPVLIAFCEGASSWAVEWLRVLDSQGPADCVKVSSSSALKRYGWQRRRLGDGKLHPLALPQTGPPAVEGGRLW